MRYQNWQGEKYMERGNQPKHSVDKKHCSSCCYRDVDHFSTPWFMVITPRKSKKEKKKGSRATGANNKKETAENSV